MTQDRQERIGQVELEYPELQLEEITEASLRKEKLLREQSKEKEFWIIQSILNRN